MKLDSPASVRNCGPIGDVLADYVPESGLLLEIASGGGYHAAKLSERFSGLSWQPTDRYQEALDSINEWIDGLEHERVLRPLLLDAVAESWPVERADVVMAVNLLHISPWEVTLGLMAGAERTLGEGGLLYIYGPFNIDGAFTSEGNRDFDQVLRQRDPRYGIRDVAEVVKAAGERGLKLTAQVAMPANNQSLIFST